MITGANPQEGKDPVWAKLLRWAADAARLVGAVFQAVYYYGRKDW
ncbi:hypothetical protein ACPCAJ_34140 [Streptomyces griseoincarnatus]